MSFHEKSNIAMLLLTGGVYAWYFATSAGVLFGGAMSPEDALDLTNTKMLVTVGIIILASIVANIAIAISAPSQANEDADERDKLVEMRGDQRGGFVLALFALAAMASAMTAQPYHLIANLILAGLVASELVKGVSKLVDYRRGV
ncbi:hypothetical protein AWH62_02030 [Maricaulis sp. W15]|uniref:Uncharacterized protein n=1 Tax=Maricaulis maris TaxID=74318 RepID=A0A495DLS9_9PROT|nr:MULTISPECIES: hypothetical protein [Maricaulis]OLF81471.1 hypothetical protein AWH62_02030 [Maricaulis sp. W15]RKR03877.1 hypothetical protein C7435_0320 [Maricaulis maris]